MLTQRQKQILILSGQGLTEKDIASQTGISSSTVHFHVENAKRRLGASNKLHALVLAMSQGEIFLEDFFGLRAIANKLTI